MIVASGMADRVPPIRGTLLASGNKIRPNEFSTMKLKPATIAIKSESFLSIHFVSNFGIIALLDDFIIWLAAFPIPANAEVGPAI